jgi:hypothetical protein
MSSRCRRAAVPAEPRVEIAMEVGLFVLGALVGVGLAWYLLERYRRDETEERQSNFDNPTRRWRRPRIA